MLQWLHNRGCPWGVVTCAVAAMGGHLEVLQWAREHHCPWDYLTPVYAAMNGHLEVLQWMRANDATGEAWDADLVRRNAMGLRKQEVLTWLDVSVPLDVITAVGAGLRLRMGRENHRRRHSNTCGPTGARHTTYTTATATRAAAAGRATATRAKPPNEHERFFFQHNRAIHFNLAIHV
jgi:hypothetical protein